MKNIESIEIGHKMHVAGLPNEFVASGFSVSTIGDDG